MPQPLTAPYRLDLVSPVAGITHHNRVYCQASASILAASGYYLFDRNGIANIDAGDAAQALWDAVKGIFATGTTIPTWLLEQYVSPHWVPVASGTLTGAASNVAANKLAGVVVCTFRTEDFNILRYLVLESAALDPSVRASNLSLLTSLLGAAFTAAWSTAGSNHPFEWARSRNTKLMNGGNPFIGATSVYNDKLRRARGTM